MSLYRAPFDADGRPMARVLLRPHPAIVRALARNGLQPRTLIGNFLVDTGADRTIVAQHLAGAAAMSRWIRREEAGGIGGGRPAGHVYLLQCGLNVTNEQGRVGEQFWRGDVLAMDRSLIFGLDGLLGRDFLRYGTLVVDGPRQFFEIRLPTQVPATV